MNELFTSYIGSIKLFDWYLPHVQMLIHDGDDTAGLGAVTSIPYASLILSALLSTYPGA